MVGCVHWAGYRRLPWQDALAEWRSDGLCKSDSSLEPTRLGPHISFGSCIFGQHACDQPLRLTTPLRTRDRRRHAFQLAIFECVHDRIVDVALATDRGGIAKINRGFADCGKDLTSPQTLALGRFD